MLEFVCILIVRNFKIIFELFSFISFSINFPALSNSSFKHYCKYTGYFYVEYQLCSAHTHTVVLSLLVCTACCIFLRLFVEIYACLFIGCSISFCSLLSLSPPSCYLFYAIYSFASFHSPVLLETYTPRTVFLATRVVVPIKFGAKMYAMVFFGTPNLTVRRQSYEISLTELALYNKYCVFFDFKTIFVLDFVLNF